MAKSTKKIKTMIKKEKVTHDRYVAVAIIIALLVGVLVGVTVVNQRATTSSEATGFTNTGGEVSPDNDCSHCRNWQCRLLLCPLSGAFR